MERSNVREDIEKALIITRNNHIGESFDGMLHLALASYIHNILDDFDEEFCINNFLSRISKLNKANSKPVREVLNQYYSYDKTNVPMELLDMIYRFSVQELIKPTMYENNREYFSCIGKYRVCYEDYLKTNDINFLAKSMLYAGPIISNYIKNLSRENLELYGPFKKRVEKTTCDNRKPRNIHSNISDGNLLDFYSSSIDKITISSDIGYKESYATQQDAVLSMKKDDCYINIVADGTGSNPESDKASIMVIEELRNWFEELDLSQYNKIPISDKARIIDNYKKLSNELKNKVEVINENIIESCPYGSTTMVMALVFPSFSIIANAGDSTAYAYDYNKRKLHLLSVIESKSKDMDYEEARHNPDNNKLLNCIGSDIYDGINTKLVINEGSKKILLSSDGVTDLISERHFVKLMKNKAKVARDFINKAKYKPDVKNLQKKMDNISAISIEIEKNYRGRRI